MNKCGKMITAIQLCRQQDIQLLVKTEKHRLSIERHNPLSKGFILSFESLEEARDMMTKNDDKLKNGEVTLWKV